MTSEYSAISDYRQGRPKKYDWSALLDNGLIIIEQKPQYSCHTNSLRLSAARAGFKISIKQAIRNSDGQKVYMIKGFPHGR